MAGSRRQPGRPGTHWDSSLLNPMNLLTGDVPVARFAAQFGRPHARACGRFLRSYPRQGGVYSSTTPAAPCPSLSATPDESAQPSRPCPFRWRAIGWFGCGLRLWSVRCLCP